MFAGQTKKKLRGSPENPPLGSLGAPLLYSSVAQYPRMAPLPSVTYVTMGCLVVSLLWSNRSSRAKNGAARTAAPEGSNLKSTIRSL